MKLKIVLLSLMFSIASSVAHSEQLKIYSTKPKVLIHSKTELDKGQRKKFKSKNFRRAGYFSALAISADGAWGSSTGNNELDAAVQTALAYCNNELEPNEAKCALYATIVPKDYKKREGYSLSTENTKFYISEFKDFSGPKAIAASTGISIWSVWNADSLASAKKDALRSCEKDRIKHQTALARESKCRLIYASEK